MWFQDIYLKFFLIVHFVRARSATRLRQAPNESGTPSSRLCYGVADFQTLVLKNCIIVDKTELIREILEDINTATLITRPRRFGKTISLSMLEHFFHYENVTYNENNIDIFKDFKISKYPEFCKLHKHKYAVLSIDFKGISGLTPLKLETGVKDAIRFSIKKHVNILLLMQKGTPVYLRAKKFFDKITGPDFLKATFVRAFPELMELYVLLGYRVIVLLDEYDVPFISAYSNNHFNASVGFLRGILVNCLKSKYLYRGVVVGINTVAKESVFSGLNNFELDSVLDHGTYSSYFGFSAQEVDYLIQKSGVSVNIHDLYSWYDGYQFGNDRVFNPCSIIICLAKNGKFELYWAKTGMTQIIEDAAKLGGVYVQSHFDVLLRNETINKTIHMDLHYDSLQKEEESFWTLLVHSGYLNVIRLKDPTKDIYEIRIPNIELQKEMMRIRNKVFRSGKNFALNALVNNILAGDESRIREVATSILNGPHSFFDFSGEEPVHSFQLFIDGLIIIARKYCKITHNHIYHSTFLEPFDKTQPTILIMYESKPISDNQTTNAATVSVEDSGVQKRLKESRRNLDVLKLVLYIRKTIGKTMVDARIKHFFFGN